MSGFEYIKNLVEIKERSNITEEDIEKLNVIRELLNEPINFFRMDSGTVVGILRYLGVPKENVQSVYSNLISPQSYVECMPRVRILDEDQNNNVR